MGRFKEHPARSVCQTASIDRSPTSPLGLVRKVCARVLTLPEFGAEFPCFLYIVDVAGCPSVGRSDSSYCLHAGYEPAGLDLQEARPQKASSINQVLWKNSISDRDCLSIFDFWFCAVLNVVGLFVPHVPACDGTLCPVAGVMLQHGEKPALT